MGLSRSAVNIWNMDFYMKFWKPGEQEFLFFALISSGSVLEVFEAQNHGNFPLAAFMQQPSTRHVKKEKKNQEVEGISLFGVYLLLLWEHILDAI